MKLAIALLVCNLLGCATGVAQQHAPSRAGAGQPLIIRDGDGAIPNTGSGTGGHVVHRGRIAHRSRLARARVPQPPGERQACEDRQSQPQKLHGAKLPRAEMQHTRFGRSPERV